jgi:hypothetical protein
VLKKQLLAARRPHEKIESEYDPPTNRTDPFGKEMRDTKIKIRKQKTCMYVANDLSCLGSQYISFMASGCRKSGGMCSIPDLSSQYSVLIIISTAVQGHPIFTGQAIGRGIFVVVEQSACVQT